MELHNADVSMEQNKGDNAEEALNLDALASMRSLIINRTTPIPIISSLFQTLSKSLQLEEGGDSLLHHHSLRLLFDLSIYHSQFTSEILNLIHSYLLCVQSPRLATESLDLIASICKGSNKIPLDDNFVVSSCFAPCMPVRLWILRNVERFQVRPHLLFTLFLGFTNDPFPYVRRAALDGLTGLCKSEVANDQRVVQGCYCRAVELLSDMEDYVRATAVRAVSECGRLVIASSEETNKADWSDTIFIQLCSMVRDMSMEIRVEAFDAIGGVGIVSEDILLQTLSKKVNGISKQKQRLGQYRGKQFETLYATAAGALVHGLEDEFYEVRKSACKSLSKLAALSFEFATGALNLLMGILNNDLVDVRLQALETMLHMVRCGHLKLEETHMHTFIGTLVDVNTSVRDAARRILKSVKLPYLELLKSSINGLLENLEKYPQDEADIFSVLFHIGQNNGNLAVCIISEVENQLEPTSEGKMNFDNARTVAMLVLAVSVPTSQGKLIRSIAPTIFSYAATLLGKISFSLGDVMSQDYLLSYLSQCSSYAGMSATEFEEEHAITKQGLKEVSNLRTVNQLDIGVEIRRSLNLIIERVKDSWSLVQSGCIHEVLTILRSCKEQIMTLATGSQECAGQLAFMLQYLPVVKLLAKICTHFMPWIKLHSHSIGEFDFLLKKVDRILQGMRCRFIGLSDKELSHLLELILLTYTLRFHKFDPCCHLNTMKKLSSTISQIEFLNTDESRKASNFLTELKRQLCQIEANVGGTFDHIFAFEELFGLFSLEHLALHGEIKKITAELDVPGNNSENPLLFVSGLPVAIPLLITLRNISMESKLWVRMKVGEDTTQYLYVDFSASPDRDGMREFTFNAPFYKTPKASSFTLRVCIGLECMFEDAQLIQPFGGPKHELVFLCEERDIYLSVPKI